MPEYIDREAAIEIIEAQQKELCPVGRYGRHMVYGSDRERWDAWQEIADQISAIHAADVAQVRHGRWIKNTDDFAPALRCTMCGYNKPMVAGENVNQGPMNYCPLCGAKMDEEATSNG